MEQKIKKIALLTGGGDCPGLNAVIRAVTRTAILNYGIEVIGYKFGYRGLYNNDFIPLTLDTVSGILHRGGTILYSSNKDNLFDYLVEENGEMVKRDVSDVAVENLKKEIECLSKEGGGGGGGGKINETLDEIFAEVNPTSMKDMGRIMKEATARLGAGADGSLVSKLVRERLQNI